MKLLAVSLALVGGSVPLSIMLDGLKLGAVCHGCAQWRAKVMRSSRSELGP